MRQRGGGECPRRSAPSSSCCRLPWVGVRRRRGRLCKGSARPGGAGSGSDCWRRPLRAVCDAARHDVRSPILPRHRVGTDPPPPLLRAPGARGCWSILLAQATRPAPRWPALASVLRSGGPIFQIEKLTLQALKCFAPASRGVELHYVRMGRFSCPHNSGRVKSIQGVPETFPCSRCLCHVSGKLLRALGFHFGSGVEEILRLPRCSEV